MKLPKECVRFVKHTENKESENRNLTTKETKTSIDMPKTEHPESIAIIDFSEDKIITELDARSKDTRNTYSTYIKRPLDEDERLKLLTKYEQRLGQTDNSPSEVINALEVYGIFVNSKKTSEQR